MFWWLNQKCMGALLALQLMSAVAHAEFEVFQRDCDRHLLTVVAGPALPTMYEFVVPELEPLPLVSRQSPQNLLLRLYFEKAQLPLVMAHSYAHSQVQRAPYRSMMDFLAGLKKNQPYNFVLLSNGVFRLAEVGTWPHVRLAGKHRVMADVDQQEQIFAGGELVVQADLSLIVSGRSGTFPDSDLVTPEVAQIFRRLGVNRVYAEKWNGLELFQSRLRDLPIDKTFHAYPGLQVDAMGDLHLLRKMKDYFHRLSSKKTSSSAYVEMRSLRPDVLLREQYTSSKKPIAPMEGLSQKFLQVIQSHRPQKAFIGPEPVWSYYAEQTLSRDYPGLILSKLLVALAMAQARRLLPTGIEESLESELKHYQGPKIWPAELFARCLRLASGDVFKALLTCHNVLAANSFLAHRAQTGIHPLLAYIRNDSAPLGDNFGAWYHLFGMASYSLVRSATSAHFVAGTEMLGSRFLSGVDPQEELMNKIGLELGQTLKRQL
ncbi:MAG: hypothetical protein AB7N80_04225 [Bdellovibrionales bacterium]